MKTLSDKIRTAPPGMTCACGECDMSRIPTKDVKQFIKDLKIDPKELESPEGKAFMVIFNIRINELAGEKLI